VHQVIVPLLRNGCLRQSADEKLLAVGAAGNPEAITPAQSGGGGWVARHLMTMLRSRDVKVLEAVLNALAVLAEDNHDPMLLMFRKSHLGVDIQFEVANFSGRANSNDYLGPDILVIVHRHPYRILGDHWWRLRSRVREKEGEKSVHPSH